ncbi:hypothetical protein [uncultured Draconibacterium sp.]|uniref:hypothetical protein n=1 Tax=uncultured Draconibacterium sp. TaxID=1573823 RepID=UPI0025D5286E|nr:hypothetical protein [uncultured Draconibacterium sp.]
MSKKDFQKSEKGLRKKISRKKAIKKIGITALTASSVMFLETKAAAADSYASPARAPKRGR